MKKTKIIAVTSNKGGVGKTTTALNLAGALACVHNKKVCAVDLSPQQNLSQAFNFFSDGNFTASELIYSKLTNTPMVNKSNIESIIRHTDFNLDFIPSNAELLKVLPSMAKKSTDIIKNTLEDEVFDKYDYIIIDCHNGVEGFLIPEIINASDFVIVVTDGSQSGFLAIDSITNIISSDSSFGILANRIALHHRSGKEIKEALNEGYTDCHFKTFIPNREEQIANAVRECKPCVIAPQNTLQQHYIDLAKEVIERTGK